MISTNSLIKCINDNNVEFISGVPDSLLKNFISSLSDGDYKGVHIPSTNEGSAVSIAMGYHLATSKIPLVYMQNSGIGNIINPISSLFNKRIFSIPILLVIGWRGEVFESIQVNDEPQHVFQGEITLQQLELLEINYCIVDKNSDIEKIFFDSVNYALENNSPTALLVRKDTFSNSSYSYQSNLNFPKREDVIKVICEALPDEAYTVTTTGMASRELYEYRKYCNSDHKRDFLVVGGMGHASQIASGLAFAMQNNTVFCIDGDGAALMHLGALCISGKFKNLVHILINNQSHDSVGGQVVANPNLDFSKIAKLMGYEISIRVDNIDDLKNYLENNPNFLKSSIFIEVMCSRGSRSDLGRPVNSPIYYKEIFMKGIKNAKF